MFLGLASSLQQFASDTLPLPRPAQKIRLEPISEHTEYLQECLEHNLQRADMAGNDVSNSHLEEYDEEIASHIMHQNSGHHKKMFRNPVISLEEVAFLSKKKRRRPMQNERGNSAEDRVLFVHRYLSQEAISNRLMFLFLVGLIIIFIICSVNGGFLNSMEWIISHNNQQQDNLDANSGSPYPDFQCRIQLRDKWQNQIDNNKETILALSNLIQQHEGPSSPRNRVLFLYGHVFMPYMSMPQKEIHPPQKDVELVFTQMQWNFTGVSYVHGMISTDVPTMVGTWNLTSLIFQDTCNSLDVLMGLLLSTRWGDEEDNPFFSSIMYLSSTNNRIPLLLLLPKLIQFNGETLNHTKSMDAIFAVHRAYYVLPETKNRRNSFSDTPYSNISLLLYNASSNNTQVPPHATSISPKMDSQPKIPVGLPSSPLSSSPLPSSPLPDNFQISNSIQSSMQSSMQNATEKAKDVCLDSIGSFIDQSFLWVANSKKVNTWLEKMSSIWGKISDKELVWTNALNLLVLQLPNFQCQLLGSSGIQEQQDEIYRIDDDTFYYSILE